MRQGYTGYEKDGETGLNYAINRYQSPTMGRFTSVDPTLGSMHLENPQSLNRYAYCFNNPLAYVDPDGLDGQPNIRGVTVGTWDQLTDEQRRLFTTYHETQNAQPIELTPVTFDANGVASGGEMVSGGLTLSAAAAWNLSAMGANACVAPATIGGTALLDQSQLTAFIGVTSMWEKAGVSGLVASVTEIVSDTGDDGYRIRGTFKEGGGEIIRDSWNASAGLKKGGGLYSVSRREPGDSPNGQFTMTKDLRRFDSDVDYHPPSSIFLHGRHENSDIRRTGGLHNHLPAHVQKYGSIYGSGPFPITRK